MRILFIDIDTLRPDHLGCYNYHRKTSPNMDKIAEKGVIFDNCFVSDAPCLPSRSSFWMGRFGIHTGVVNHGGLNADPYAEGKDRGFRTSPQFDSFALTLKKAGFQTVTISSFAGRHSAWWFLSGFQEIYETGKGGVDRADEVYPYAEEWLNQNAKKDNWFLHVNLWDPHTSYRTPEKFGRPFEKEPVASWISENIIKEHYSMYGPHSAQEINYFGGSHHPHGIQNLADYKKWIDGYDTAIRYADFYIGKIINLLKKHKIFDDTAIIITSDHGENQGELNIYGDHQTSDYITSRVPFIIKWPGLTKPGHEKGLHYQTDLGATILELLGLKVPEKWDGESFASGFKHHEECSRDYLVVSQCAWSCQRAVIFKDYVLIKTYDTGFKYFPELMLFNIKNDPHELRNIAKENSTIVKTGLKLLEKWHKEMMKTSEHKTDPLDEVMAEGGPFHTRGTLKHDIKHLTRTNRGQYAKLLKKYSGKPIPL